MSPAEKLYNPKKPRGKDVSYIEADILTNLRLAAEFARLAEAHGDIFDDSGFNYCVERFLSHARLVSEFKKKLKGVQEG